MKKTRVIYSNDIVLKMYDDIRNLIAEKGVRKLSVILIGNDLNSHTYVEIKKKKAKELGIPFDLHKFSSDKIDTEGVISVINKLNKDKNVFGILVQLPLNEKFDSGKIINAIDWKKDVDRVTHFNIGRSLSEVGIVDIACTSQGIMNLLDHYKIDLFQKNVVLLGSSLIVGKPLIGPLIDKGATITILNKHSLDIGKHTKKADIVISATGKKHIINSRMIKKGVILIDVGITKVKEKIYGDVDIESVKGKSDIITSPKGCVGPLTVATIFLNLYYDI